MNGVSPRACELLSAALFLLWMYAVRLVELLKTTLMRVDRLDFSIEHRPGTKHHLIGLDRPNNMEKRNVWHLLF